MKSEKSKGFWRRLLYSRTLLVVEGAIIILFGVALAKEVIRRWEVHREINKLQDEIAYFERHNTELSGMIAYFQSDYYKEREARLKLGLQKEGESALTVPITTQLNSETETETTSDKNQTQRLASLPQKWWDYFFANE